MTKWQHRTLPHGGTVLGRDGRSDYTHSYTVNTHGAVPPKRQLYSTLLLKIKQNVIKQGTETIKEHLGCVHQETKGSS